MVLGIDTATSSTVVGLLRADGTVAERRDDPPHGARPAHASRVLALVAELVDDWSAVERIAVGVGPGGFTGLRIGIATARGLAQARGLELVPVSSLHALAAGAFQGGRPPGTVAAAIDARRGEAFLGIYRGDEVLREPAPVGPEVLAEAAAGLLAIGDGALRFREQLERAGAVVPADAEAVHRIGAGPLCRLGAAARTGADDGSPSRLQTRTRRSGGWVQIIRRLTYADLPAVVAIERRTFPAPWSLAMFVLELSRPGAVCLVSTDEEQITGYVICSRHDTVWHLMDIAVAPERRRAGIGTTLVKALLERLPGPDEPLTLEVRPSNTAAIEMYEGFGFRTAGIRRRYYSDNGEDALIMWRTPGTRKGTLDDVPNADPRAAIR